jgi:hypothetical protein
MRWPWFVSLRRGDVNAIAICIAILALILFAAVKIQNRPTTGFGPDWDCTNVPQGEVVCVKKPAALQSGNTARPSGEAGKSSD